MRSRNYACVFALAQTQARAHQSRMDITNTLEQLRRRALKKHRSIRVWLRSAGVAPSTWYAWVNPRQIKTRAGSAVKRTSAPNVRTLERLEAAAGSK